MNIVLVHKRAGAVACIVRGDGSAFQLGELAVRSSPFDPNTSSDQLIPQLGALLRSSVGGSRSAPVRLVAYVPPGTDGRMVARLEASAFAAGFQQVRLLTLAEIATSIAAAPLPGRVLAIDAGSEQVSALEFDAVRAGERAGERVLTTELGMDSLKSSLSALFSEEGFDALASSHPDVLEEMALQWGRSSQPDWIAESRRWTSKGWRAMCICGEAAERLDKSLRARLRPIIDSLNTNEFKAIVVLGELGEGVLRLVGADKGSASKRPRLITDSLVEGAVQWVRDRRPPPTPGAGWNSQIHVLLDMETARSIGVEDQKLPRNPTRVPLTLEQKVVIAHVPATLYADGIQLQLDGGDTPPVAVLGSTIRKLKKPSFGVDILARRLPDGGVLVKVDCAAERARAVILVRPEIEPVVLEFNSPQ